MPPTLDSVYQSAAGSGYCVLGIYADGRTSMKSMKKFLMTLALFTAAAYAQTTHVLPQNTEIKVRTDTAIPAKPAANAKYTGTISNDVVDNSGAVAIPRGTKAQLVAVPTTDGKDTNLDLRSVAVSGQKYLLTTQTT